jgi:hypothetical protein
MKNYGPLFGKATFHYTVADKPKTVTWALGTRA